jgi:CubicO group peptidase (beta-lactamase class C family)
LTPTSTVEARPASWIDDFVTNFAKQDRFSGSVLIAKDGKVLISKGYGLADVKQATPNTPQKVFRIGSMTKQFTAMAILLLQQQGKLNVKDLVCQLLPDCPETWQPITIRQLLNHTSGIPDFVAFPTHAAFKQKPRTPVELIAEFRDRPLDFVPGRQWAYSNSGYVVLGYLIEQLSGQPYCEFVGQHIFQPLQMTQSGCDSDALTRQDRVQGYAAPNTLAGDIDMSVPYAAGGLYSTVEDLFLWDQSLYTTQLIPQALVDEMFRPSMPIPDAIGISGGYGYGWIIGEHVKHHVVWHRGGIEGFRSEIDRYLNDRITIIVLSNREDAAIDERGHLALASDIARLIFEAP